MIWELSCFSQSWFAVAEWFLNCDFLSYLLLRNMTTDKRNLTTYLIHWYFKALNFFCVLHSHWSAFLVFALSEFNKMLFLFCAVGFGCIPSLRQAGFHCYEVFTRIRIRKKNGIIGNYHSSTYSWYKTVPYSRGICHWK